ncbi:ribosomal protein S6 kinase-like 1 isoform X4 [Pristis pectinata]|uniref:ribosomal protein S6 kinase-like 1 isoform X4 n=1 Tax=Pristis pectinata TaxID=685728 RepID=UPI00223E4D3D|nr:ribosomal protein S6 kinase-like 1 isoform X4 [Pristis pectinata]
MPRAPGIAAQPEASDACRSAGRDPGRSSPPAPTLTMHSLAGERPSGQDVDPCSRPLSQARVYLEQIRSRVSPSAQEGQQSTRSTACKRDYLVDAAKQIRLALDREVNEDYEAAFNYYKNGVDLLLKGVQVDPNKERREAVKRKTTQYLKRAEEIFDSHLQGSLGNGTDESGGFSSLRFRPNRILSSPVEDLKMSKVIAIIDKVLLVQNPSTKEPFIVKSLPKCSLINRERQTIIPQGVPFMVQLLQYYVSDDTVFLHLEHVPGGKLWSQLHHYWPSITEKGMEFPECSSPHHKTIKLKNSYTAPSLSITCNDTSTFAPVSKEGWQREDKNKMSRECMMEYSCNTDGLRIPQSKTEQGGSDKPPCHMNGANQRNAHNEYANRTRIWQGNNKISKASLSMNGLKQSPERSSFQVAHFEYRGGITFDLAFLSEEDGDLTQSSKIMNQTMTSSVDNLMQKDLWHGKSQLLSQGHICLTYFGQWSEVEVQCNTKAIEDMYCAPEVGGVGEVTEACDWWSLGALLFELLTGTTLSQCYPSRIHPHTQLRLPDHLSPAAVSLLQQLLQWDYRCRLGSGENGTHEIKSHSFFSSVHWNKLNGYR